MQLAVRDLCRGCGKMFFHASVDSIARDALVEFLVFTKEGLELPTMVFEGDDARAIRQPSAKRSFTIVIPLVNATIDLICRAVDADGAVIDEVKTSLNPHLVKWRGRTNVVIDHKNVSQLRNCDQKRRVGRVVVELWDYLAPKDADGVLRGRAVIPCDLIDEPASLVCIDAAGHEIEGAFTTSPARVVKKSTYLEAPFWEIAFSIRVPHDSALTVIAATSAGKLLPGFEAAERWQIKGLADEIRAFEDASNDPGYDEWLRKRVVDETVCDIQRRTALPVNPAFSLVVAPDEARLGHLDELVGSVLGQTYENWELLLVNAHPADDALAAALRTVEAADARIKTVPLSEDRGATLNAWEGIAHASGDFVAFPDPDGVLEPDTLFEYARAVGEQPDTDVIYCDEDVLTKRGKFSTPLLKPDFSIDLLRSSNYVRHLLAARTSLLRALPQQTDVHDGAFSHHLALLTCERARHVHHVARVLYHGRPGANPTAADPTGYPCDWDASVRCVQDHLDRLDIRASALRAELHGVTRVDYEVIGNPLVSIVIPNKDQIGLLSQCLESLFEKSTYDNFEVIVVENNSEERATFDYYEQAQATWDKLRVVYWQHTGFNFSHIVNFGVEHSRGDYLVLLNNDIEVIEPRWIDLMLGICQRPEVGAVGAMLYYPDDTVQHAGVGIIGGTADHTAKLLLRGEPGYFGWARQMRDSSAVTAACLMTPRAVFDQVGCLDPDLAVAFNDVDLCLKIRDAGYLIVFSPYVELYHYESVSRGFDDDRGPKQIRFHCEDAVMHERWAEVFVQGDPYLNPNLTRSVPESYYWNLEGSMRPKPSTQ